MGYCSGKGTSRRENAVEFQATAAKWAQHGHGLRGLMPDCLRIEETVDFFPGQNDRLGHLAFCPGHLQKFPVTVKEFVEKDLQSPVHDPAGTAALWNAGPV